MCRRRIAQAELLRVRWNPDRTRLVVSGHGVGRSFYVCQNPDCRAKALDRGRLERALRTPVGVELRRALAREIESN